MTLKFNRGNAYFDTYHIYNEKGQVVGIIEHHCRDVKEKYFIGWRLDSTARFPSHLSGKTQMFDTLEDALLYSVGTTEVEICDWRG
jgi:hypothetical protein